MLVHRTNWGSFCSEVSEWRTVGNPLGRNKATFSAWQMQTTLHVITSQWPQWNCSRLENEFVTISIKSPLFGTMPQFGLLHSRSHRLRYYYPTEQATIFMIVCRGKRARKRGLLPVRSDLRARTQTHEPVTRKPLIGIYRDLEVQTPETSCKKRTSVHFQECMNNKAM